MKVRNTLNHTITLNKSVLESAYKSKIFILPSLYQELNEKIDSIKNWAAWCKENKISYDTLLNLKYGKIKYINYSNVLIFELLEIDVAKHYEG